MINFDLLVDSYRIFIFVSVQWLIALTNSLLLRPLPRGKLPVNPPLVSVLVPARNEGKTIRNCLASLLNQDYPNYELLVLNDHSEDLTLEIVSQFNSPRLKIIDGQPLPEGWTGKNWACHQLARKARGEILLFTDADTVFAPDTISRTVIAMQEKKLALLTGLVKNRLFSQGEMLTVPFIIWSIMAILPLGIAYLWRNSKAFMVANGKFLVFTSGAYQKIGGHQAVRNEAAEDLALGRLIKGAKLNWRIYDVTDSITTRMYTGFRSAWAGFTKNFFAIFDYRLLPALFVWCWLLIITFHPLVTLLLSISNNTFDGRFWSASGTVSISIGIWLITTLKARLPKRLLVYYPLITAVACAIGLTSIIKTLSLRTEWKGRRLPPHRIKIF